MFLEPNQHNTSNYTMSQSFVKEILLQTEANST
jgi:hypothetical protein